MCYPCCRQPVIMIPDAQALAAELLAMAAEDQLPVDDPQTVDRRRASVGLGPVAEEVPRRRAAIDRTGEQPPADWAQRR